MSAHDEPSQAVYIALNDDDQHSSQQHHLLQQSDEDPALAAQALLHRDDNDHTPQSTSPNDKHQHAYNQSHQQHAPSRAYNNITHTAHTHTHHASHATPTGTNTRQHPLHQFLTADGSVNDWFFELCYTYYIEKGYYCCVLRRVTSLLTLGFTIGISTFLLLFIDWRVLLSCRDEESCQQMIVIKHEILDQPSTYEITICLYTLLLTLYWCWQGLSHVYYIRAFYAISQFYNQYLSFNDTELNTIEWYVVAERMVDVQYVDKWTSHSTDYAEDGNSISSSVNTKTISYTQSQKPLTLLDITNRIMRRENYMIALVNLDLFELSYPFPACKCKVVKYDSVSAADTNSPQLSRTNSDNGSVGSDSTNNSATTRRQYSAATDRRSGCGSVGCRIAGQWKWFVFGRVLEWNIRFCLFEGLFVDQKKAVSTSNINATTSQYGPSLRPTYRSNHGISLLERKFAMMGIINLLLLPFIILFTILHFFLRHAEELHSKRTIFGPRQWSPLAQWKLREFNELHENFNRRLQWSNGVAQLYVQQFPSNLIGIIASCIAYISGAIVGILLVLTVSDSVLLVSFRIYNQPLLWHLALFSAILAISRSCIPQTDSAITTHQPAKLFDELLRYTHYYPSQWRGKTHTQYVHQQISMMYRPRVVQFLCELLSVVLTPFILIFRLPRCAAEIVQFIESSTVDVEGVGHCCAYATFEIEKYGDERYSLESDAASDGSKPSPTAHSVPRMLYGKVEKSLLSFAMNNPRWQATNITPGKDQLHTHLYTAANGDSNNGAHNTASHFLTSIANALYAQTNNTRLSVADSMFVDDPQVSVPFSKPLRQRQTSGMSMSPPTGKLLATPTKRQLQHHNVNTSSPPMDDPSQSLMMTASNAHLLRSFADMMEQTTMLSGAASPSVTGSILQRSMSTNAGVPRQPRYLARPPSYNNASASMYGNGLAGSVRTLGGVQARVAQREELANSVIQHSRLFSLVEDAYDRNTEHRR